MGMGCQSARLTGSGLCLPGWLWNMLGMRTKSKAYVGVLDTSWKSQRLHRTLIGVDPARMAGFTGLFDIAGLANAFIEKQVTARRGPGSGLGQAPSKLEHLFGCSSCNFNEAGCKHCYDTPFASRPAARAKPAQARYQNTLPAAPTFYPTAEEWQDPFAYLSSIAPEATKAGIACIRPPQGWEPPIQMLDQQTGQLRTDLQVPVRIQPTHLLCRRWPTPAGAPPKTPKAAASSEFGEDGSDAEEEATPKKSNAVAGRCSKAGMAAHKAALVAAALAEDQDEDEDGDKDVIINPAHLDAVATAAQATDGQFGYEHLEEPLSLFDFHRYADWAKRRHFNGPVMSGLRKPASSPDEDQQQQQPPVVSASTAWRAHPPTEAVRNARGVSGRYAPSSAGVNSSSAAGEWEEPSVDEVEAEFWRIVEASEEQVEALYAQDIDTATYRSAFPTIRELAERQSARLVEGPKQQQQQRFGCVRELAATIGASEPEDPCHCISMCECGTCQLCVLRAYAAHPWNINNIPQARGSVLRFVREDVGGKPITGLMVPWVYVGSCFSAFCWHIEDHGLYSINYNHMGAPKIWYGVPAAAAAALDAAMRDALPHLFDKDHLLLHKLITMLSPAQLAARGVPVCRAVQVPGSFIVTFPDAYHAGFNSGFNVAEAVNFAAPDWLPFGSSSVVRYRNEERYMTFSHDAMLINVVKEAIDAAAGKPLALPAPPSAAAAADALAIAADDTADDAERPAALRCSLKEQFKQHLAATVTELGDAEAAAAEREWWPQGRGAATAAFGGAGVAPNGPGVRMVAPPVAGGSNGSDGWGGSSGAVPAVDFCKTPLDSSFWWAWYPEESWADAAAVTEEAAAEGLQRQAGQQQDSAHTPTKQQRVGEGHHLAAASVQHHNQGQRERVFTMRGATGGNSMRGAAGGNSMRGAACGDQQQQEDGSSEDEEEGGITPGVPAAGAAAAAAAAGPPPRVVAAAARSFAVAAFAPAASEPLRKQPPSKKAAAIPAAEPSARPSVAERIEKAVKAITTYTLCLAEARRQRLLVQPPSPELARLALGELALRVELEQTRQAALLLKSGLSRCELMVGNSAATDAVSGVHTNTQGVECAVCGCDLSLAAVVSSEEPGRAVCPAHAADLDGPRSSAWALLRYPPGYLDRLVATGLKVIPGAAEAVQAARNRQSWVAAGRFFGGAVLSKRASGGPGRPVAAAAGGAAGGVIPVIDQAQQRDAAAAATAIVAATVDAKQDPASAAAAGAGPRQEWKQQVPVIEVKLRGRLYDPNALSKRLFEDLDKPVGADSSSQSWGWDDGDDYEGADGDFAEQPVPGVVSASQQQGAVGKLQRQQPQQQQQGEADGRESGGDASSGDHWEDEVAAEDGFGFYSFRQGGEGSDEDAHDTDDDFRPAGARGRKRRRPASAAATAAGSRKVKVEQQGGGSAAPSPDAVAV